MITQHLDPSDSKTVISTEKTMSFEKSFNRLNLISNEQDKSAFTNLLCADLVASFIKNNIRELTNYPISLIRPIDKLNLP